MSLCPFLSGHQRQHPHHGGHHYNPWALREFLDQDNVPYWQKSLGSLNLGANVGDVENSEQKFAVKLDVSQFKPEELKINLEGRQLTITGNHEVKTENGFTKRSFTRQFQLPEDVDLAAVHSALSQSGQLSIDAPKVGATNGPQGRPIPIHTPSGKAITH